MTPSEPVSVTPAGSDSTEPPRRTSPRTIAALALSGVTGALVVVAPFALQRGVGDSPVELLALVFGVLRTGYEVVAWWARTYTVGATELVIDEGVATRHHRVVPYARVQQVDVHRSIISQVLGLAELRLDTAGAAGATTVRLRLLDVGRAERLRTHVLARREALQHRATAADGGSLPATPPSPVDDGGGRRLPGPPLLEIGPGRLIIAAVTQESVLVAIPVVALAGFGVGVVLERAGSTVAAAAAVLLIAIAMTVLGVAASSTVIQRWNYVLSTHGDDLHLRFGLSDVRHLTIPRARVQHVTVTDNPVRRRLGLVSMTLHSAAPSGGASEETHDTRFEIPILERSLVDDVLATLMGDPSWSPPPLTLRPPAARRRAILRRCLALVAAAVLAVLAGSLAMAVAGAAADDGAGGPHIAIGAGLVTVLVGAVIAAVILGWAWGVAVHGRSGHGVSESVVAFGHGALHHHLDLVPVGRVQSCRTTAGPLHRRNRLAVLHIDVAGTGRAPRLYDIDVTIADHLMGSAPRR